MKILEYGYYDFASNEIETKENISRALKNQVSTISVLPYYAKSIRLLLKDHNINLGTVIDYPFGLSDLKARISAVDAAIKSGCNLIEILAPTHLLCNRKYDKFRDDINTHRDICDAAGVELRYTIDYRIFTLELLYKVAQILIGHKINTIYPSSNYFLDNLTDNILASALITKKIDNINVIVNGNAWTDKHVELIWSHKQIFGYKTNNLYVLEALSNKLHNNIGA